MRIGRAARTSKREQSAEGQGWRRVVAYASVIALALCQLSALSMVTSTQAAEMVVSCEMMNMETPGHGDSNHGQAVPEHGGDKAKMMKAGGCMNVCATTAPSSLAAPVHVREYVEPFVIERGDSLVISPPSRPPRPL